MISTTTSAFPRLVPASSLLAEERPDWLVQWARFAAGFSLRDVQPSVLDQTRLVMLDCLGVIASGMQEPENRALARRLAGRGTGAVAAIGAGVLLRADDAAFLNGTAGTALELDEGNQFARGHPGIHIFPAALASGMENGASGAELLRAFLLAYDLAARIGTACRLRPTVHPHGTWGTVGAAFAAALLARASWMQLGEVISAAATLCVGASLRAMLEGATVRNSYCGFSNRNGLAAWDLVASGFTAEADAVRSVYGSILADGFDANAMTQSLGQGFEIERNYFKRHAACRFTHGTLDVVVKLVQAHPDLKPQDVASVDVQTYASAAQLDGQEPHNTLAARFSLPFAVATTIAHRKAAVEAFRDDARNDNEIRALARRVKVSEDPALTAMLPAHRPARVRIALYNGVVLAGETFTNRGDAADPFSPDEVRAKFRELTHPVWGTDHTQEIHTAVETIETAPNLSGLNRLLAIPAMKDKT